MSMLEWAERECRIACQKENPEFDFDGNKFDYGCSCYKSALKAFQCLCNDGHSGFSWNITKNILTKLMDGRPLTPITENDFSNEPISLDDKTYLCKRMFSLFKHIDDDGNVIYSDNDRAYYIDIEKPSDTFLSSTRFLDKMFPISMPYMPAIGKYKIYSQTFLVDKSHGDFDTRAILYVITPDNERVEVGIYQTEGDNHQWIDITKEEYETLLTKRIDTIRKKVADHLIWTLISNSSCDSEIKYREKKWKMIPKKTKDTVYLTLEKLCIFFENPEHYKYNTFECHQELCKGRWSKLLELDDLRPIEAISAFLKQTLEMVLNYESR